MRRVRDALRDGGRVDLDVGSDTGDARPTDDLARHGLDDSERHDDRFAQRTTRDVP